MVVTGLEIAAAVFAIVGGFANCVKLAELIKKRLRKRKAAAAPIEQATRLHSGLRGGGSVVDEKFGRLKKRGAQWLGIGNDRAPHALWSAYSLLQSLASELEPLALQTDLAMLDFSRYQTMADRSRAISEHALHQLADRIASSSTTSLLSGSTLVSHPPSRRTPSSSSSPRAHHLDVHNICELALRYRANECAFESAATRAPSPPACRACGTSLAKVSAALPSAPGDAIWIGAPGLLKSHCAPERGRAAAGWTCIWRIVSRECYHRFESERALLKHMKTVHVGAVVPGQEVRVDWPSDSRGWTAEKCGYGVKIGGRKMQEAHEAFVVPGA